MRTCVVDNFQETLLDVSKQKNSGSSLAEFTFAREQLRSWWKTELVSPRDDSFVTCLNNRWLEGLNTSSVC